MWTCRKELRKSRIGLVGISITTRVVDGRKTVPQSRRYHRILHTTPRKRCSFLVGRGKALCRHIGTEVRHSIVKIQCQGGLVLEKDLVWITA